MAFTLSRISVYFLSSKILWTTLTSGNANARLMLALPVAYGRTNKLHNCISSRKLDSGSFEKGKINLQIRIFFNIIFFFHITFLTLLLLYSMPLYCVHSTSFSVFYVQCLKFWCISLSSEFAKNSKFTIPHWCNDTWSVKFGLL